MEEECSWRQIIYIVCRSVYRDGTGDAYCQRVYTISTVLHALYFCSVFVALKALRWTTLKTTNIHICQTHISRVYLDQPKKDYLDKPPGDYLDKTQGRCLFLKLSKVYFLNLINYYKCLLHRYINTYIWTLWFIMSSVRHWLLHARQVSSGHPSILHNARPSQSSMLLHL